MTCWRSVTHHSAESVAGATWLLTDQPVDQPEEATVAQSHALPTNIGVHTRRFGRAAFALMAILAVIVVAVVTLALARGDAKSPTVPTVRVASTWNTPDCSLHGHC
jgi:hypothetical protein